MSGYFIVVLDTDKDKKGGNIRPAGGCSLDSTLNDLIATHHELSCGSYKAMVSEHKHDILYLY